KNPQKYHYMNLSTENPSSVMEVIQIIEQAMNKKAMIKHHDPRPGDPLRLSADATKAREILNWQSKTDLATGLKQTVDYFVKFWQNS
ncbi:MAG: hypothetical protein ABIJ22_03535, partial [Patescibacteria group bacterium]